MLLGGYFPGRGGGGGSSAPTTALDLIESAPATAHADDVEFTGSGEASLAWSRTVANTQPDEKTSLNGGTGNWVENSSGLWIQPDLDTTVKTEGAIAHTPATNEIFYAGITALRYVAGTQTGFAYGCAYSSQEPSDNPSIDDLLQTAIIESTGKKHYLAATEAGVNIGSSVTVAPEQLPVVLVLRKLGLDFHAYAVSARGDWAYLGKKTYTSPTWAYAHFIARSGNGQDVFNVRYMRFIETSDPPWVAIPASK